MNFLRARDADGMHNRKAPHPARRHCKRREGHGGHSAANPPGQTKGTHRGVEFRCNDSLGWRCAVCVQFVPAPALRGTAAATTLRLMSELLRMSSEGADTAAAALIQARVRGNKARKDLQTRALRTLFAVARLWGSPTRGQTDRAWIKPKSPTDATLWERQRDVWLAKMMYYENTLLTLTLVGGIGLLSFGAFIAVLFIPINFGVGMGSMTEIENSKCNISLYNESLILAQGTSGLPPRVDMPGMVTEYGLPGMKHWVAHWCTPAQWWFNVCVKYFSFYFCFVNALPLPWTISIWMHVHYPRKKAKGKTGVDFYGVRTESIWFHLPVQTRRRVAWLNLIALIVQIPDGICREWPRARITPLPLPPTATCVRARAGTSRPRLGAPSFAVLRGYSPCRPPRAQISSSGRTSRFRCGLAT